MTEKAAVARALLGSWPQQVSAWGPDAINEYVNELAARGLGPDECLDAIRTWPTPDDPSRDFPPSASALAAHALRDPDVPSFAEVWDALAGREGVLKARTVERKAVWASGERVEADERAMLERLATKPEPVQAFVAEQGIGRLRTCGLLDPEFTHAQRRLLEAAWEEFVGRGHRRTRAALLAGVKRGGLRRADPLAVVGERSTEEVAG